MKNDRVKLSVFFIIIIGKVDIQREERERKIFSPMIHSPSEHNGRYCANPKPGASSRSPTRVEGPKVLGRPRLLSQAASRELDGKWSIQNTSLCMQGEDLVPKPSHRAHTDNPS